MFCLRETTWASRYANYIYYTGLFIEYFNTVIKSYEELNDLYFLPNIVQVVKSRTNEMGRACGACGGG